MQLSQHAIKAFQTKILHWYAENKRDLPWRETRNPYNILISEVMAQQTQLSRIVPKYVAWLEKFPTIESLAKASTHDLLAAWSGLGYNRRALYLQKAAKEIVEKFNGKFPDKSEILKSLSGIGEYTAKAIACFAFDQQVAVVDTNIKKVILTQFTPEYNEAEMNAQDRRKNQDVRLKEKKINKMLNSRFIIHDSSQENGIVTDKDIQSIADQLLPVGHAYEWNQALMDYAAVELKKEKISLPKQSKFIGSDRYYRGQIIKILIEQKKIDREKLCMRLKKEESFTQERYDKILKGLQEDALVTIHTNILELPL